MSLSISDSNNVGKIPHNALALDESPFDYLPQEIIRFIFELSLLSGIRAGKLTCKEWNRILDDNNYDLWKRLFKNHFPSVDVDNDLWKWLFKNHFPSVDVDINTIDIESFHSVYKTFYNLYSNLAKEAYAPQTLQGHRAVIYRLAVNPNSSQLFSASSDGTIKVWDTRTGECLRTLQRQEGSGDCLAFDVNGEQFFSAPSDDTIKAWNTQTGKCLGILEGLEGRVYSLAVGDSGKVFLSSSDHTIKAWDTQTGKCLRTLQEGHEGGVPRIWNPRLALNAKGEKLFSSSCNCTIEVWDTRTDKRLGTLEGHKKMVYCLAFDANRKQLFSASFDGIIKVWDTETGECFRTLQGHGGVVYHLVVDPSSGLLLSCSWDDTIKVWDIQTGKCLGTLQGRVGDYSCVAFIGGKLFFAGIGGNNINVWDFTAASQDTIL